MAYLFLDVARYSKHCDPCQRVGKPTPFKAMPLIPILAQIPFEKWSIDFVGPIKPSSHCGQKQYILVATNYVNIWAKALATKVDDAKIVAKFVSKHIIIQFGCPKELVSDRGTHFFNATIEELTNKYLIKHRKLVPYYPRANGQTKKTNGILQKIITKAVQGSNIDILMCWFGPYKVLKAYLNGSIELQDLIGTIHATWYNEYRLKPYII